MPRRRKELNAPYSAYHRPLAAGFDEELTRVGRTTPCGEYLRRFWHPVALAAELGETPLALRILGEDLVAFRDGRGRIGLLDRHCSHRNTSLEYGRIEETGIRCCYHGWQYDIDGRILDTPGEPAGSKLKDRLCHGAYPAHEYKGLVFAYMGPPEKKPVFPIYDLFERPDMKLVPNRVVSPCNWLQVRENEMDPVHITFLHTRLFGTQFTDVFGDLPSLEWIETPLGMMYITVRRRGAFLYLRSNDMILPNIARVAGIEDGDGETLFDRRGGTTNWVVPIDDTSSLTIGWDEAEQALPDPRRDGYLDRMVRAGKNYMGPFDVGQTGEPSYAERQRAPGDWDAWSSQGPINPHDREHLGSTDVGVAMYRRLVRRGIRAVGRGKDPKGVRRRQTGLIPTYAQNTVQRVPEGATPEAEQAIRIAFGREITAKIQRGEIPRLAAAAE